MVWHQQFHIGSDELCGNVPPLPADRFSCSASYPLPAVSETVSSHGTGHRGRAMCLCEPRVQGDAPPGATLPVNAADIQQVRGQSLLAGSRWSTFVHGFVWLAPHIAALPFDRSFATPPRPDLLRMQLGRRVPARLNLSLLLATWPFWMCHLTDAVRLSESPAPHRAERLRRVLPQVHYYVECCLVQKMDRTETVRALQAVGVTPCFTELGAAVRPPFAG